MAATAAASGATRTSKALLLLVCLGWCSAVAHAAAPQKRPIIRPGHGTMELPKAECAKTCFEQACDTHMLRYGKYCGVGHSGCPDEEPCDPLDACCQVHDVCVEKKGLMADGCHKDFLACMKKVREERADSGFSKTCAYSTIIPTMEKGIEASIKFTKLFTGMMNQGMGGQPDDDDDYEDPE